MEKELFDQLIIRYQEGRANPDEIKFIESYYQALAHRLDPNGIGNHLPTAQEWEAMKQQINIPAAREARKLQLWKTMVAVAAALAAIALCIYFFYPPAQSGANRHDEFASGPQDLNPGKNGATISLSSGEVIQLSDAKKGVIIGATLLKYDDGTEVAAQARNGAQVQLTASTTKGQTYEFTLPDGSHVYLNADSKISFPSRFTGKDRRVKLEGEGYFEIAKDKVHPFILESRDQEVAVLGTHFNVNSYPDEAMIATTLVEGSVKVSSGKNQEVLKPGLQALNNGQAIKVVVANLENITDWKEGEFNLDGIDFKAAMRKISRWYNVEVIYDATVPSNIISGGWISRDVKLSTILEGIERSGQVHFKLEGRKLYVSR